MEHKRLKYKTNVKKYNYLITIQLNLVPIISFYIMCYEFYNIYTAVSHEDFVF